jgi:hypothetical protein
MRCDGRIIKVYLGHDIGAGAVKSGRISVAGEVRAGVGFWILCISLLIFKSESYAAIQEPWSSHQAYSTLVTLCARNYNARIKI